MIFSWMMFKTTWQYSYDMFSAFSCLRGLCCLITNLIFLHLAYRFTFEHEQPKAGNNRYSNYSCNSDASACTTLINPTDEDVDDHLQHQVWSTFVKDDPKSTVFTHTASYSSKSSILSVAYQTSFD